MRSCRQLQLANRTQLLRTRLRRDRQDLPITETTWVRRQVNVRIQIPTICFMIAYSRRAVGLKTTPTVTFGNPGSRSVMTTGDRIPMGIGHTPTAVGPGSRMRISAGRPTTMAGGPGSEV